MSGTCRLVETCRQPAVMKIGYARLSQPLDQITWKPACIEHLALHGDVDFLNKYFGPPELKRNYSVIIRPLEAQTVNGARP
jgi:hypothetical protein